ncbi:SDR family oxidoreductase [Herbaspirillum sp. ST 5-3]|uniref:SDR family oxidoreductase n=1 Tax=Oxalobacteraceae TaxID=75682 RepID=UPI0010A3C209|nr:SDR family oxidoreductase [Herbaspirillum sp. ST 5-3]
METIDYSGKNVVVTGAAGGLGHALCERFAAAGANVALVDVDGVAARAAANRLRASGLMKVIDMQCDVTDPAACNHAMQAVIDTFGGIDVLINNAGIAHRSLLRDTSISVLRRVMDVNFFGAVHCTQAALSSICERRGQVVVISSIAGFSPLFGRTGYSASKHALHGFFDSLRSEVEDDGVDISIICPSFVATGIERAALGGDGGPATLPRNAVGGEMSAADMADRIYHAARRRRQLHLPGLLANAAWWISRLAPATFARQMKRRVTSNGLPQQSINNVP